MPANLSVKPACLDAHVTLNWKHVVIYETTFRRYVKKNFKYIPEDVILYRTLGPKLT